VRGIWKGRGRDIGRRLRKHVSSLSRGKVDIVYGHLLILEAAQAQALESTLEEEKRLLVVKLKERDHMIRCDEVYAKITSRPRTKEELKEWVHLVLLVIVLII
jgi:hypothetical protein